MQMISVWTNAVWANVQMIIDFHRLGTLSYIDHVLVLRDVTKYCFFLHTYEHVPDTAQTYSVSQGLRWLRWLKRWSAVPRSVDWTQAELDFVWLYFVVPILRSLMKCPRCQLQSLYFILCFRKSFVAMTSMMSTLKYSVTSASLHWMSSSSVRSLMTLTVKQWGEWYWYTDVFPGIVMYCCLHAKEQMTFDLLSAFLRDCQFS